MTAVLFRQFLERCALFAKREKRKICLLCDQCSAHSLPDFSSEWLAVRFFPTNCTAVLQPLDGGVIHSLKAAYRRLLLQKFILHAEGTESPFCWSVSEAIALLNSCWDNMRKETIANCFHHVGITREEITNPQLRKLIKLLLLSFPSQPLHQTTAPDVTPFLPSDDPLFEKSKSHLGLDCSSTFQELVTADDALPRRGTMSVDEIIKDAIAERSPPHPISETKQRESCRMNKASLHSALRLLQEEGKKGDAAPVLKRIVTDLEKELLSFSLKGVFTPQITTYFPRKQRALDRHRDLFPPIHGGKRTDLERENSDESEEMMIPVEEEVESGTEPSKQQESNVANDSENETMTIKEKVKKSRLEGKER
jgi:hypothetical protein